MNSADTLKQFEAAQTQPAPWPELPEETLPIFPTNLLPGFCGELVQAVAASIHAPVDYAACALLGAASSAIVGRVSVQLNADYSAPVQLFCGMGGESGTGKSPVMKKFIRPLELWLMEHNKVIRQRNQAKQYERDILLQNEKKEKRTTARIALHRQADAIEDEPLLAEIQEDTTPEALVRSMKLQNGCGVIYTSEGGFVNVLAGATYGRQGGVANIDSVLKGYDADTVRIDRVTGGTIIIEQANLSLTVGLQPSVLHRLTDTPELANRGLPQRLLFFLPEELRNVDLLHSPQIPPHLLEEWSALLCSLASIHRSTRGLLPLTQDARNLILMHMQNLHDRAYADLGNNAALRGWVRKASDKTLRLSALLALLENPSASVVEESHTMSAVALMNGYFIPHAKHAFGGGSDLSEVASDLWKVVQKKKWSEFRTAALRKEVRGQKRFQRKQGEECIDAALNELQENGYIRRILETATGKRGAPPSPLWETNPAARSAEFIVTSEGWPDA